MGTVGSSSWCHRRNIELELDRRWEKTHEQWTANSDFKVAISFKRGPKSSARFTELWAEELAQAEGGMERCPSSDAARTLNCQPRAGSLKGDLLTGRRALFGTAS